MEMNRKAWALTAVAAAMASGCGGPGSVEGEFGFPVNEAIFVQAESGAEWLMVVMSEQKGTCEALKQGVTFGKHLNMQLRSTSGPVAPGTFTIASKDDYRLGKAPAPLFAVVDLFVRDGQTANAQSGTVTVDQIQPTTSGRFELVLDEAAEPVRGSFQAHPCQATRTPDS
jgi:hypothetical protein